MAVVFGKQEGTWGLVTTAWTGDQGKAANGQVGTMAIEIAWWWLRFQPNSGLNHWFLETGVIPEGAELRIQRGETNKRTRADEVGPVMARDHHHA